MGVVTGVYDPIAGALPLPAYAKMHRALQEVVDERDRQHAKWGEQNHADGTGPRVPVVHQIEAKNAAWWARSRTDLHARTERVTYLDILLEEVFEAAECADPELLRAELVQVAAVAVAWVEKLDRESR